MAAWSGLFRPAGQILFRNKLSSPIQAFINGGTVRFMSERRTFPITPSRWHWDKTKDLFHLYVCIGLIPIGIAIFCIDTFIGPAQLTPIPEGYEPKHWEYHRHPISRFMLRYVFTSEQQEYEKMCHLLWTEEEISKLRALERKVKLLIAERKDYQSWYFEPYIGAKYVRKAAQQEKDCLELYTQPQS